MKEIHMKHGFVALVDDSDFERVRGIGWCVNFTGRNRNMKYVVGWHARKQVRLHRFILNPPPGVPVDHRDGNTLDCRRENLRLCTGTENNRNRGKGSGTSRFKGVRFDPTTNKWKAQIKTGGKSHHLGYHEREEDAAKSYDRAAMARFGAFARLNFAEAK